MQPLTQGLIIANVVVFLIGPQFGNAFIGQFALWPIDSGLFMPW